AVTYIDVGIKLEVEPTVQLDNEVVMKVSLEVSSLGAKETSGGPQPTSAYRIGTRNASTSLRLRDGETQVLAGLINDEDRKFVNGVPFISEAPLLGRLFGQHNDTRKKSEIVLLITPRVLRNVNLPDATQTVLASG
ncbi:type II secretion system protein GspD, partial [Escherichia coli]|uniref:type II secretion system protein GspD n=1 Tax=Escherichia coli TaxID=562 RepID=UPI00116ADCA7